VSQVLKPNQQDDETRGESLDLTDYLIILYKRLVFFNNFFVIFADPGSLYHLRFFVGIPGLLNLAKIVFLDQFHKFDLKNFMIIVILWTLPGSSASIGVFCPFLKSYEVIYLLIILLLT